MTERQANADVDMPVHEESQDAINQREWDDPLNWTGLFGGYSSKRDTRLWVPKRGITGDGLALNFGHPGAKTFIAGICIMPAAFVLALILLRFAR
jgi:uncharacterized membrane protein